MTSGVWDLTGWIARCSYLVCSCSEVYYYAVGSNQAGYYSIVSFVLPTPGTLTRDARSAHMTVPRRVLIGRSMDGGDRGRWAQLPALRFAATPCAFLII